MITINTLESQIEEIIAHQREFFCTGETKEKLFRKEMLIRLQKSLLEWEPKLSEALWADMHKSYEEAYLTELSIVQSEIKNHLKNIDKWMKPQRCSSPLKMMPSTSKIIKEPLGCSLIIAPWNYPVQLLLNPLVGAISTGCTAILKPSPYVPNVSATIEEMIRATFDSKYIAVVQGNREVNKKLLENRFDIIFFTGSPSLGKTVMEAAAKYLTPVILELGGKSPCIIDKEANIEVAATRLAWGKTLNAGQTCVAPDYLLLHKSLKEKFIQAYKDAICKLHGHNIQESKHFVRIISDKNFDRLTGYLNEGKIIIGGKSDKKERYIEPTLLADVSPESEIMKDEIFGPILPMITFSETDEAIRFINKREKPLALYYFGTKEKGEKVLKGTSSGGACINDVIMHLANENIPFGGVGNSGMGHYHGKYSFDAFSHQRSVVNSPTYVDLPFRYMPYKMFKWVKKLL